MLVKSILSTFAQLARLATGSLQPPQAAQRKPPGPVQTEAAPSTGTRDALRQIVADYDVRNISPRAFSEMLQRLRQAGALPEADFQDLSTIRLDLEHEGVEADQQVNLLEIYARKLNTLREDRDAAAGLQAGQNAVRRRLEWLGRFAQIQTSGDPPGVNTLV